jgi:hypothetical protein
MAARPLVLSASLAVELVAGEDGAMMLAIATRDHHQRSRSQEKGKPVATTNRSHGQVELHQVEPLSCVGLPGR